MNLDTLAAATLQLATRHAYPGHSVTAEAGDWRAVATIEEDHDQSPPWKTDDGHGPVREARRPRSRECTYPKRAGEIIMHDERGTVWLYDYAEACHIARRDRWGTRDGQQLGETARQYAARAARADFDALRAFLRGNWYYVGVKVSVSYKHTELGTASLWRIDCNYPGSDNSYLDEVAAELLAEAIADARETLQRLTAAAA